MSALDTILLFFALENLIWVGLFFLLFCNLFGKRVLVNSPTYHWAWGLSTAAFILFAIVDIDRNRPSDPQEMFATALKATACMGFTFAICFPVLPIIGFLWRKIVTEPATRARESQELRAQLLLEQECIRMERAEQEARRQEQERQEALRERTKPILPTREQLFAQAKARYEAALQFLLAAGLDEVELKSARDRAKQQYLRDIDPLLE